MTVSGAQSQCARGTQAVLEAVWWEELLLLPPALASFSQREKQGPGGGRALCMHGNAMSRTHPVPALGTPVLPHPCHKEDKQGHCVCHLKVNLVHVKGAGNTTQTTHNVHFSYTLT